MMSLDFDINTDQQILATQRLETADSDYNNHHDNTVVAFGYIAFHQYKVQHFTKTYHSMQSKHIFTKS